MAARHWRGALFCGVALLSASAARAQATASWSLYDSYQTTYSIPFSVSPGLDTDNAGFFVEASINGGTPAQFQMDTGSQGMVLPQVMVPGYQQPATLQRIAYGSSGNYAEGSWSTQTVTFPGSSDGNGNVATAEVPVFIVQTYYDASHPYGLSCVEDGSGCAYMIGIGFGRPETGSSTDYQVTLDNNPLLHLAGMDEGTVRAGYVITADGIQAGLTAANAGTGFSYVQLLPSTAEPLPNWQTPGGTVVVNGTASASGVLVDTGIDYMWAYLGTDVAGNAVPCASNADFQCAPAGTTVAVYFGGTDAVGYSFTVGDSDNPAAAPSFTRLAGVGVNTGIHVISSFSYLFDAVGGFVGYQAVDPTAAGIAFTPYLSATGSFAAPDAFTTNLPLFVAGASTISAASSASFSGAFTGSAPLTFGGGSITLSGSVTLPGGITVSAGSVSAGALVTAPLSIASGASFANLGGIVGDVTNAGTFFNDDGVTGDVDNDGLLGGNGSVSGTLTTGSGAVSPGHSVGLITVGGDLIFGPGSYYAAEIDAQGVSDRIEVAGGVVLDGATLQVLPTATWVPGYGSYRVIEAGGAVTGAFIVQAPDFGSAQALYPFLQATAENDAQGVRIEVGRSDVPFVAIADGANSGALAQALDSLSPADPLVPALAALTAAQANGAYEQLTGSIQASLKGVLLNDSVFLRDAVLGRLRTGNAPGAGTPGLAVLPLQAAALPAAADEDPRATQPAASPSTTAAWMQGFGSWGSIDGDDNAAGLDSSSGGVFIGVDTLLAEIWRVGVVGGYSHTSLDESGGQASASSDDYYLGVYGGVTLGPVGLRLGAAYAWHAVDTDRSVAFPGFADSLSASYGAGVAQVFGEVGYALDLAPVALEPFAGLAYAHLHTDSFDEDGGAAALSSPSSDSGLTFSTLGLRAGATTGVGGLDLAFTGSAGWRHAFGDVTPEATLALPGSESFDIAGLPVARDAAVVGAGVGLAVTPALTLGLSYSGQYGDGVQAQGVQGSLTWRF